MRSRLLFALIAAAITCAIGLAAWLGSQAAAPAPPAQAPLPTFGQLPADTQALAAGQALYAANCVSCHGADGRGDPGYAAERGAPLPDLTVQMKPGLRSDVQLSEWIKKGISGTAMPGFGLVLGDGDVTRLVAFLRTLAQPGQAGLPTLQQPTQRPTLVPIPDQIGPLPPTVFVREGKLWRGDGGTGEPQLLASLPGPSFISDPAVARDGRQVAFVALSLPSDSASNTTWRLYVVGSDGQGLRPLGPPTTDQLSAPVWAPDNAALVVGRAGTQPTSDGKGSVPRFELSRVDLASGTSSQLQDAAFSPAISPDGSQLAFVRIDPESYAASLQLRPLAGGPIRSLVADASFGTMGGLIFAPDGQHLIFAASGGPNAQAMAPLAQAESRSLLAVLGSLFAPGLAEAHGAPQDLWQIGSDGQGLRRLTTLYEDEPRASFSPDGQELLVMGVNGIYRLNADGSNLRRIDRRGDHGGLVWLK